MERDDLTRSPAFAAIVQKKIKSTTSENTKGNKTINLSPIEIMKQIQRATKDI
jgi:hypothetical protein